jgi:predicted aspartyl protease
VLVGGVVTAVLGSCRGVVSGPVSPRTHLAVAIESALAAGDLDQAELSLQRARAILGDTPVVLLWSATLAQMRWRDVVALEDLRQLNRLPDRGDLDRAELLGWIGDLLFRTGSYAESIPFLFAGRVGDEFDRRHALSILARDLPYNRTRPDQLAAELPLLEGPLPELLCTIGRLQQPFVLDTGASFTTVARSVAATLGVEPIVEGGFGRDGAQQTFSVAFGVLPSLSLGQVELEAQPVMVIDDEQLALRDEFGGPPSAPVGLVGLDVLTRFRVTFDPERRSVLFELPRGLDPDDSVACVQYDGSCLVPVQVEAKQLWFVVDTGASHSSLTNLGLAALPGGERRASETFRRVRRPGGRGHAVREVAGLTLVVADIRFSGVDLPIVFRPPGASFPIHGVLGADLLMRCRTTLDLGRLRLQTL